MEDVVTHFCGEREYLPTLQAMQQFTDSRDKYTSDELWFLQHPPVFTLGKNADPAHILDAGDIPVIPVDRGGQVTYHGPGQLVVYTLLDLNRRKLGIRGAVSLLEDSVVGLLAEYGIGAHSRREAPGVYVEEAKIAALGLRIRKGCCFHGLAFNVAMDLEPFSRINPCGYKGLSITQLSHFISTPNVEQVGIQLQQQLLQRLSNPKEIK